MMDDGDVEAAAGVCTDREMARSGQGQGQGRGYLCPLARSLYPFSDDSRSACGMQDVSSAGTGDQTSVSQARVGRAGRPGLSRCRDERKGVEGSLWACAEQEQEQEQEQARFVDGDCDCGPKKHQAGGCNRRKRRKTHRAIGLEGIYGRIGLSEW